MTEYRELRKDENARSGDLVTLKGTLAIWPHEVPLTSRHDAIGLPSEYYDWSMFDYRLTIFRPLIELPIKSGAVVRVISRNPIDKKLQTVALIAYSGRWSVTGYTIDFGPTEFKEKFEVIEVISEG